MMRWPAYHAPQLNEKIVLRSRRDNPEAIDQFGRADVEGDWGVTIRANRRDRRPSQDTNLDGVDARLEVTTTWTIRERDVPAQAEVVDMKGNVYEMVGGPVQRGGQNGGLAVRYLELPTRLITA